MFYTAGSNGHGEAGSRSDRGRTRRIGRILVRSAAARMGDESGISPADVAAGRII